MGIEQAGSKSSQAGHGWVIGKALEHSRSRPPLDSGPQSKAIEPLRPQIKWRGSRGM
jgi:hypothetical protein